LGNFDNRDDEGIFLGYATNNKGYIFFNKRMHKLVDCIYVWVDEEFLVKDQQTRSDDEDTNEIEEQQLKDSKEDEESKSDEENSSKKIDSKQQSEPKPPSIIVQKNHPESQIIGDKDKGIQIRRKLIKALEQS
jgi:hypothetical protein